LFSSTTGHTSFRQVESATDESGIPDGMMGLDVGPKSLELFKAAVDRAQTILWNG
jgi:phosphoglycerate kinase